MTLLPAVAILLPLLPLLLMCQLIKRYIPHNPRPSPRLMSDKWLRIVHMRLPTILLTTAATRCASSDGTVPLKTFLFPVTSFKQGSSWEPAPPIIPRFVSGRQSLASIPQDAAAEQAEETQPSDRAPQHAQVDSRGAPAMQRGNQQADREEGERAHELSAADIVRARTAKGLSRGSVQVDTFEALANSQASK